MDNLQEPPHCTLALECKTEWCEKILSGQKTIECRQYPCPAEVCGQQVLLVATGGEDGVATLLDETPAGYPGAQVVGWAIFSDTVTYKSPEEFAGDFERHCVPAHSVYALREEGATAYGWRIAASGRIHLPRPVPQLRRILRSVHSAKLDGVRSSVGKGALSSDLPRDRLH